MSTEDTEDFIDNDAVIARARVKLLSDDELASIDGAAELAVRHEQDHAEDCDAADLCTFDVYECSCAAGPMALAILSLVAEIRRLRGGR